MVLNLILFLIIFPFICSFILYPIKNATVRTTLLKIIVGFIILGTLILLYYSIKKDTWYFSFEVPHIELVLYILELIVIGYIAFKSLKHKKYGTLLLAAIQFGLGTYFQFRYGDSAVAENSLFIDRFSVVMALIVGIIGSLICVYTIGYMRDYNKHHPSLPDNRRQIAFVLCIFLSAMFGIIFSNNLMWMSFFWEITTVCSFFLIGYPRSEEAVKNSFTALFLNLIGGVILTAGVILLYSSTNIIELDKLLTIEKSGISIGVLAALCLAFAGLVKSAQFPFSKWLLGAMVAPTPVSALLHSSTMVKAGVYLIVRIMPVLAGTLAANCVALIGAITFLIGSFIAISQRNAKRVLAYSTIANLGLIVACAGVGSFETIAAAILLIIFHAVAKSVLFLCAGSVEHKIGSRDIETWDWLIIRIPIIAAPMIIGIGGMFLPPLGMLISKWVVLGAFADSHLLISPLLIGALAFGSAFNLFFWTKWLGKIISTVRTQRPIHEKISLEETIIIWTIAILTIITCFIYPVISKYLIEPYLKNSNITQFFAQNSVILSIMLLIILVLPMSILVIGRRRKEVVPYMSGRNSPEPASFEGTMGRTRHATLKNYYLEDIINEKRIFFWAQVATVVLLIVTFTGSFI